MIVAPLLLAAAAIFVAQPGDDIVGSGPGCRAIDDYRVSTDHYKVRLNDKWVDVRPSTIWLAENLSERGIICFDHDDNIYLLIPRGGSL